MKHPLIINSRGKIDDRRPKVIPSLPYYGIARRAIRDSLIEYDREIDVSAVIIWK
jgi:hypothetical protein